MHAVKRSPFFRIAVLGFAVLFAQTVRASAHPIIPVCAPCPGKVAASQPEPEKKLFPSARRIARPGRLAHAQTLFGASLDLSAAHRAGILTLDAATQLTFARSDVSIDPQRRPFVLRV